MKILVVDDSSTMRRIIKNTLNRMNLTNIIEAVDGEDGIKQLESEKDINIIIDISQDETDWNMPNIDGLTFVKYIRKNKKYDDIPIIMITTEGGKTEVITALKASVNNYIIKPFTPNVLMKKLQVVL